MSLKEHSSGERAPEAIGEQTTQAIQARFAAAVRHHQAGELIEAEQLLRQVLALDPRDPDSLHLLGVVAYQTGRQEYAIELIGRAIEANADRAVYHSNLGNLLQRQGRLDEAIGCYRRAIALQPDYPGAYSNLGNALREKGQSDEAIACYRAAIDRNANYPEAHNNLGVALLESGQTEAAADCYRRAIELKPDYADAHNNLGNALRELGRLDEAIESFRRAIALRPDYPEAHNNLGIALQGQGRAADAVESFQTALDLKPDDPDTHVNLGIALTEQGRLDEAIACYGGALAIRPDFPEAHYNRGNVRWEQGQLEEAVACYRKAIALRPDYPDAYNNLGNALWEQGRPDEAAPCYRRAIELNPNYAEAYNNLSIALQDQGHLDEAIASSRKAIALKADFVEAYDSMGNALRARGRPDEAIASYRRAIDIKPDYADAHSNLAMALLARGDMEAGWREYEWRWQTSQLRKARRDFAQPQWHGEPAEGRTLLIHAEQGFGDTLQFCRYAPLAAARGLRVILEVPRALVRLLGRLPGVERVVAYGDALPPFDQHCPMLSMPLALGTTLATIPAAIPYLHADAAQVAKWRTRLEGLGKEGRRIGLVWAGNPRKHLAAAASVDRRRSMPLEQLAPLFELPGLHFLSLQKGSPVAAGALPLTDLMDEVDDFADTAALIANLDLVISVDTSVVHLAAGLGKPVWLLDRFDPCWRWLTGRDDSPWYPTLRLFRQPNPGDWPAVIRTVRTALGAFAASHSTPETPPDARRDLQALFAEAVRQHRAGQLDAAEALYHQVIAIDPHHADGLHLLGVIAGQSGLHDMAADMIRRAIAVRPNEPAFHSNLGISLKQQGRLEEAIACFRAVADLDAENPEAHNNLGIALKEAWLLDDAVASYRRAITLRPDFPQAHYNLGNALWELQRTAEAAESYRRAVDLKPDYPEALNNLGNALRDLGQVDAAVAAYQQALALNPDYAEAQNNLGIVVRAQGRPTEIAAALRAVERNPDDPEAHFTLAVALRADGQTDGAIASYRKSLALRPDYAEAHNNLGNLLRGLGRPDEAVGCLREAVTLKPDYAEAYNNLGIALQAVAQLDEAVACYRRAIELRPDLPEAHNNLGTVLQDLGSMDEAVACYRRALELRPDFPEAHNSLGTALQALGRPDEAVALYRQALGPRPDYAEAYNNLATALQAQGRLDEATANCRRAIDLNPDFEEAYNSLGTALLQQGRLDEAIARYRRAIELRPDYPEAHNNLAMALLARGDMAEGWAEYEWRWKMQQMVNLRPAFAQPQWRGEPAAGRTLLIHAEQGFGDTLQFCRYAPLAAARGLRVILEVPAALVRLLRSLGPAVQVMAQGDALPEFDLHCPMLSLPLAFGTTIETVPAAVPYLQAEPGQVAAWRAKLDATGTPGPRVGLVWAGNPRKHLPAAAAVDRRRSLAPERLAALVAVSGLHFLSLQKDGPPAPADFPLTDLMGEVGDFADTAALVANLDLVISVDTSVAHLAAALGKRVWLLDRFDPCWRWLVGRQDSPWYPTLRLFRQPRPDDWGAVIDNVRTELRQFVAEARPVPRPADMPALFAAAVRQHQSGQLAEAERLYGQVLQADPGHADSLHLLGVIYAQTGRHDLAADRIGRAISVDPRQAAYHSNLGVSLRQQGRLDEAVAAFRAAVALKPQDPEAHNTLGIALKEGGRLEEAAACYRRAIELHPGFSKAHYNLGLVLKEQGRPAEAAGSYRRAIELQPNHPEPHNNLGNALVEQGLFDEAITSYRRAIDLRPADSEVHSNLGTALHLCGRLDDAAASYRRALELNPSDAEARSNLGTVLREQGDLEAAVASYRDAIAHSPKFPEAHSNLGMALLAQGDLEAGWSEYEWRWQTTEMRGLARGFVEPQWRGEAGDGRTLLIHAEQGLGDTLQFCRYGALAAARGWRVVMEVQPELVRLLQGTRCAAQVVARGETLPPFDVQCPMLSLPMALGTTLATVPAAVPYLHADTAGVDVWRQRLDASRAPGLRVGLAWAGSPRRHLPTKALLARRRSVPPDLLGTLFAARGVQFVSLQKDASPASSPLADFMGDVRDFADTAALVANLDLIVSVDTSIVHLAGALGKPVWLLDRFDSCWRWIAGRRDSPWYPTLRIYRQTTPGDWQTVLAEVARDLETESDRLFRDSLRGSELRRALTV